MVMSRIFISDRKPSIEQQVVQKETTGYAIFCRGEVVRDVWTHFDIYQEKQKAINHAQGQGFLAPYRIIPVRITIDEIQEVEDTLDGK